MNVESIRVLLVEETPADAGIVKQLLGKSLSPHFDVAVVEKLATAIPVATTGCHDVILLDLSLPDSEGLEGLCELAAAVPHMPILVLGDQDDESMAFKAITLGAQDYLVKRQDDAGRLRRAVCYAIKRKAFEADVARRAHSDRLTGLANRALFEERLQLALARAKRTGDALALMFIDLDEFQGLDDAPSHDIRDEVLRIVADRVRRCVRESEAVARLGGNNFAVLLDPLLDETNPKTAAERILAIFREPLLICDGAVRVALTIGIAIFPDNASDSDTMLRCAEAAMIRAKSQGQNNCGVYVSQDQPFGAQFNAEALPKRH